MRGHVMVCGSDGLAVRVVEELRALGEDVVLIVPRRGVPPLSPRAVALLEDDDAGNLQAALASQELGGEDIEPVVLASRQGVAQIEQAIRG